MSFRIAPSRRQWDFMQSDAFVNLLMGPRGEGKTTSGYYRLLHQAKQLPGDVLPLRCVAIRDTLVNLRDSTIRTLHELEAQGLTVEWVHEQGHEAGALVGGGLVEMRFLGLDRMAEVNKLQGQGAGVIWLEEPAPAADISGGIPPEVFGVAATSLRQPGIGNTAGVMITMNPPDEDHWTLSVAGRMKELEPKLATLLPGLATRPLVRVVRIPKGENAHYTDQRRAENQLALEATGRGDLVSRLIEGQVGQIVLGEPVIPEYNDATHLAPEPLPILRHALLVRAWDFGLTPTCIWTQVTPSGFWHLLWAVQGVNMGVEQLIDQEIRPWESIFLRAFEGLIRDVGDPAGRQREQSNSELSAVATLEEKLSTTFENGPVYWPARRDALRAILSRMVRGVPVVRVDPEARLLRRALRGGWHYPKDALGRITPTLAGAKKASGLHDHVGHALCYGASVLFPVESHYRKASRPLARPPLARRDLAWMSV